MSMCSGVSSSDFAASQRIAIVHASQTCEHGPMCLPVSFAACVLADMEPCCSARLCARALTYQALVLLSFAAPRNPTGFDPTLTDPTRSDGARPDPSRSEPTRLGPSRPNPTRRSPSRPEPTRPVLGQTRLGQAGSNQARPFGSSIPVPYQFHTSSKPSSKPPLEW